MVTNSMIHVWLDSWIKSKDLDVLNKNIPDVVVLRFLIKKGSRTKTKANNSPDVRIVPKTQRQYRSHLGI